MPGLGKNLGFWKLFNHSSIPHPPWKNVMGKARESGMPQIMHPTETFLSFTGKLENWAQHVGDFNCICHATDRSVCSARYVSAETFQDLLSERCLVDIGCGKGCYIQFAQFQHTCGARLERIYITANRFPEVCNYMVKPIFFLVIIAWFLRP